MGHIKIELAALPVFIMMMLFSLLISFNLFFLAGCSAFWVDNATGMNYALRRVILFLAGGLIPLSFFPSSMQKFMSLLPFKYMFDLPVKFLTGKLALSVAIFGLGMQFIWALILWALTDWVLHRAIRHNQSVGI